MRALVLGCVLLAGCERTSTLYCEKNPDKCTSTQIDAPVASGCTTDDACKEMNPQLPYCIGMMACGACRTSADCVEPTGVCDPDTHACRGCMTNGECPSEVCIDPTNTCASAAQVAYVGGTGPSTTCTITDPCATLELALALSVRPRFIKLVDTVTENVTVLFNDAGPLDILGSSNAINFSGGIGLKFGGQANVTISNVEITPSAPDTNLSDDCILLETGTPMVRLVHATIHGCGGDTVDLVSGSVTIDNSELYAAGYGVEVLGSSTATITHTIIHHNTFSGVSVNTTNASPVVLQGSVIAFNASISDSPGLSINSDTTVTDTIIAKNGSSIGMMGGVLVTNGTSAFEFVTIADNISGAIPNKGMSCVSGAATIKNSIITGNAPSTACPPTFTFLDFASTTTSNRNGNPLFIAGNGIPTDAQFYRLQNTSPAIGGADPDPNVPKDIDGDKRSSDHPDMGADEHN